FDLRANPPRCRELRGHRGFVQTLALAPPGRGRPAVLASAGVEHLAERPGAPWVVLRLWDVEGGRELGRAVAGQYQRYRPRLALWPAQADATSFRVASAWTDGSFLVWDPAGRGPKPLADPFQGRTLVLNHQPDRGALLTGHFGRPPGGGR